MMRPPPRVRIAGRTARLSRTTLRSSESMARDQSSSVSVSNGADFGPPVLVTRMSIPPRRLAASSTRRSMSAARDTSATMGTTEAFVASRIVVAAASSVSWCRPQIATAAPFRARAIADARPRPLLAAHTSACLPRRSVEFTGRSVCIIFCAGPTPTCSHSRAPVRGAALRPLARAAGALLAVEIGVGVIQPVLADRAEQIELERVVEGLGLVLDPRRDVEHLPLADGDFLAGDEELQRSLQHVGHLLALVRVHRHERALLEIDLRQHLALAGHDLARDHLGHLLERQLVPAVQPYGVGGHGMGPFSQTRRPDAGAA